MTYFAYIHAKPDGTPFYVGKGVRKRDKNFRDRNPYHKRIVAKYGVENILVGRLECSSNEIALELEIGLIKCLKRMGTQLANITDGGEGALGRPCSEKTKQKVSEANKNRVWDDAARLKMSIAMTGVEKPNQSKTMKEKKFWKGENNPWYGTGSRQLGVNNHMARGVKGTHQEKGSMVWGTLKAASEDLNVSIQAISQAIRKHQKSKGWKLEYIE
jgi:hypothetical protein